MSSNLLGAERAPQITSRLHPAWCHHDVQHDPGRPGAALVHCTAAPVVRSFELQLQQEQPVGRLVPRPAQVWLGDVALTPAEAHRLAVLLERMAAQAAAPQRRSLRTGWLRATGRTLRGDLVAVSAAAVGVYGRLADGPFGDNVRQSWNAALTTVGALAAAALFFAGINCLYALADILGLTR